MSELEKLKFPALDVGGTNYIVWSLEASNYLCADGLADTIEDGFVLPTGDTDQEVRERRDAARAVCLLLRHLHKDLKFNYLEERNPAVIWNSLRLRFDTDRKQAMLPLLNDEWNKLCFYNFKTVTEYTTKLYSIASELSWCGKRLSEADKIEKTLTTFSPAERILSMQYRRMNHDTFDKLVAALLLDEKHGILLQKNHDERRVPTTVPAQRTVVAEANFAGGRQVTKFKSRHGGKRPKQRANNLHERRVKRTKQQALSAKSKSRDQCRKCGLFGHWADKCRSPDFHCKLYQQSKANSKQEKQTNRQPRGRRATFTTDFSDDDDVEVHCVQSYSVDTANDWTHCLIDCATTHVILTDKRFFVDLITSDAPKPIKTVGGTVSIAKGIGRAEVKLPNGTPIVIPSAIYAPGSSRNLLSFVDLRRNGLHVHTATTVDRTESLRLVDATGRTVEECEVEGSNGLYCTRILPSVECDSSYCDDNGSSSSLNPTRPSNFALWHDRLGHPGKNMLRKMIKVVKSIPLKPTDTARHGESVCSPCAMGKFQNRAKHAFVGTKFKRRGILDLIVSDVCGPISPPSGPFHYFMIVKDETARYSKVQLLTSRNEVMPKLLTSIIQLKAQFPEHPIKNVRVDNASEYVSASFQEFCASSGITLETSTPYAHNTNAENFVKQVQMVARPLLLRSNLPLSCWGHAVLHAGDLLRYRPSSGNNLSPYEIVHGFAPSVAHLRVFGSAVYVPIPPHQQSKLGPKRQLGIYVGFQSPSIIRYLSPQTGDLFTAHITMCVFAESKFPTLGDEKEKDRLRFDFDQPETKSLHKDPYNGRGEKEVRRILHLHRIVQNAPDAFAATERMTRSELNEARNYPAEVEVDPIPASLSGTIPPRKRGRPKGAKDRTPRKRRTNAEINGAVDETTVESTETDSLADALAEVNISSFLASTSEDAEPQTVEDCKNSPDWPMWKAAIRAELQSLIEREVFGDVQECPAGHQPIGCRWVFTRKRDQTGRVIRFKARLVAQGFTQRFGIDYSDTYSPVMTMTTLRWLLAFAARNDMQVRQADIETAYLYGLIDVELYLRVPDGLRVEGEKPWKLPCVQLRKSLYGLKQAGRLWYLHFSQYLLKCGFQTHECSPCLFVKRSGAEIAIIGIYVDDIVMVGTDAAVAAAMAALKTEFKVKDLGPLSFCLGLQVSQIRSGIILHQTNYITKVLTRFNTREVSRAAKTPMVVRSLSPEADIFGPRRGSESVLSEKYPYKEAIGALLYLANCSRPDIAFAVSVLARYTSEPTKRHWSGIRQLLRYLARTRNHGLLYRRGSIDYPSYPVTDDIYGFADAGYLSDPHKARSQTGYVFMSANAAISWRSTKQVLVATSTNQSELIALYEASRESIWLRRLITFIRKSLRIDEDMPPIEIYEDNAACVAQVQQGYIKSDRTKHIDPKFFFMHDLNGKQLEIKKITSDKNLADLFTKSLGSTKHIALMEGIGMVVVPN